ncbi:TLDc domain, partial [Dillenia turbinata]
MIHLKNLPLYCGCRRKRFQAEEMVKQQRSFPSKAAHFVTDLTTVFLNPISDRSSKPPPPPPPPDDEVQQGRSQLESIKEEVDGPDTSSFTAFLYSLWSSESGNDAEMEEQDESHGQISEPVGVTKENGGKKSLLSRGKQSLRAAYNVTRLNGFRNQASEHKNNRKMAVHDGCDCKFVEEKSDLEDIPSEAVTIVDLPETSEPSLLLSDKTRRALYVKLPTLVQGRKWVLLYSTWRHGISLSTLYRRSMLWPGLSLLVVGDRKGAVFGGLVEAPLKPSNKRKYQGSNDSFVFTNVPGQPKIFRPTGVNRYFTLCHTDYLALGGGHHFALYLDRDLLTGSSSVSETYGNTCLACSEDFEVKEVELWGFVYGSKYEEVVASCLVEAPGISR